MWLEALPDALRQFGVEPVEVAGWQRRGRREFAGAPKAALRHWTAGARTGRFPSLRVLIDGRADLPGPLCQLGQERRTDGQPDRVYVIAAGVANHAGRGEWAGASGNGETVGLEIEWSGPNETFPTRRREVSERAIAALASLCSPPSGHVACEHREYALPPGRKPDTNLDGHELRVTVAALLRGEDVMPEKPTKPAGWVKPAIDAGIVRDQESLWKSPPNKDELAVMMVNQAEHTARLVTGQVRALIAEMGGGGGQVDPEALAAVLAPELTGKMAERVADVIARRLEA